MQKPSLIHLEHALPPLAELGLEHLAAALLGGGRLRLDADDLGAMLKALAHGAEARAARRLLAVAKASGEEILAWETDEEAERKALQAAALAPYDEAKEAITGFFASLGLSLNASLDSSETPGEAPESPGAEGPASAIS
jgi:hypothetical protein